VRWLRRLSLNKHVLVDVAMLLTLIAIALSGLGSTFTGSSYLVVGMLGAVLAALTTVAVVVMLRWSPVVAVLASLLWFFLLGPVLCLRDQGLGLPGPRSARAMVDEALGGWKDLLTTLPPVDGDSRLLVLPWLLGLATALLGTLLCLAPPRRRLLAAPLPLLPPVALLAVVILLGLDRPESLWAQGACFAVVGLGWLGLRYARLSAPVRGDQGRLARGAAGVALLGMAGLLAVPVATWASGSDADRVILREHVEPPFDVGQYPSPLASFRRFVELPAGHTSPLNLHETTLFTIEGVPSGSRVRLAVLDRYDGVVWGASNHAQPGVAEDVYQRVSSVIDNPTSGEPVDARVTVGPGWNSVWLPTVGALQTLRFEGEDRDVLAESFRYNLATSSAVVPAGLHTGDVYTFTAVRPGDDLTPETPPSGAVGDAADAAGFLDTQAVQWSEGESQPMRRVFAIARHLKSEGKYSDGVVEAEKIYHAGHNRYRLTDDTGGVNSPFVVGNDEQYAAWMALLANRIGVPARVVFGAIVPQGGEVTGADVHAWVEVQVSDGTWHTLPTELFMDYDRPAEQQTTQQQEFSGSIVPPPAPIPPPSTTGEQNDTDMLVRKHRSAAKPTGNDEADAVEQWVGRALLYGGIPVLAIAAVLGSIVGAKAWRRHRRRRRSKISARFVGGWAELVDHARDLGHTIPVDRGATRREQSAVLESDRAVDLARDADKHVFGPRVPRPREAEQYWKAVDAERRAMSTQVPRTRRVRAALSLTTFRAHG